MIWHSSSLTELNEELQTNFEKGLSDAIANYRLKDFDENLAELLDDMKETIRMGLRLWINEETPVNIFIGGYSLTMTPAELENYFMSLNPPVKPFFLFLDGTADNFIKQLDKELINSAKKWMNETVNSMPKDLKDNIQIGYTLLNNETKPIDIIINGRLGTKTREEVESYFMNLNPPVTPTFNLI